MNPGDIRLVRDSPGLCVWDYPISTSYLDFGESAFDIIANNELIVIVKKITVPKQKLGFLKNFITSLNPKENNEEYYAITDRCMKLYYVSEHSLKYSTVNL